MFTVGAIQLSAQVDTGTILGTVKDSTGAVIPGAKVTLTNEGTNYSFSKLSEKDGSYVFTPIPIGTYSVTAEYQGFRQMVQKNVVVQIQQQVVVNFTLQPGQMTQSIQVTAPTPLLQTQTASVGQVVGTSEVNDLPLEGRNYVFLAQLAAGATKTQYNTRGLSLTGSFNSNGTQSAQNDYLLDGIDNNANQVDFLNGTAYVVRPPVDAVQEFKVQTGNFSAEFGRSAGSVLNATLKSGTNHLHGDVWEFVRNSGLDGADFYEDAGGLHKGEFRQNQFGLTLGGPVEIPRIYNGQNKTFFFADYEGMRIRQAQVFTESVPTALEASSGYTNYSDLITGQTGTLKDDLGRTFPRGTVFDPATTRPVTSGVADPVTGLTATATGYVRDPFAGNIIPATRLDPVGLKLAALYPLPTNGSLFNNFNSNPIKRDDYNNLDVRGDHNFSANDTSFVRVSYDKEPQLLPTPFPGIANGLPNFLEGNQITTSNGVAASETHVFSPSLVNEFRAGYSRISTSRVPTYGNELGIPAEFGIPGVPQFAGNGGLPQFTFSDTADLGTRGFLPTNEINPTWQIDDNITRVHGAHTLKAGAEVMHIKFWTFQPTYPKGIFNFNGVFTSIPGVGDASTDRAQLVIAPTTTTVTGGINDVGGPNQVEASNVAGTDDRENYIAAYVQDNWKITKRLTLDLGVRWEYYGFPYERWGNYANFVPGAPGSTAAYIVPQRTCSGLESSTFLTLLASSGIQYKCSNDVVTSPFGDIGPRFGFAFQATSKLVVRGGYGIFYNGFQNVGYGPNIGGNYPFLFTFNSTNPDPGHPLTFPNGTSGSLEEGLLGFSLTPLAVNGKSLSFNADQYNADTPSTDEWNLTVQYQLTPNQTFQLGYVANVSRHLFTGPGANVPSEILPPSTSEPSYIPFPSFGIGSSYVTEDGSSNYNSLQANYERRFSYGLNILANYTYSKCRTDARDELIGDIGGYRAPYLPNFGIQADYALCDFDTPNMVHLSGGWVLPLGNGQRYLHDSHGITNAVLGGWQTNWILSLQDGNPFSISCPNSTVTGMGCFALLTGQNVYAGPHNANQWLNPAAFANPTPATSIGQSNYEPLGGAPTQALAPGYHRFDLSLFKEMRTSETTHLEFRTEVFNLTNHPNFGLPTAQTNFTNTKTFTESTLTIDDPYDSREIQFAMKFYW